MARHRKGPDGRGSPLSFALWLYLFGQTVSNLGSAFTSVALPLLVFRLTGSATALGAATAVSYAPWVLFGLVGGAVVDRIDRRRLLVLTDLARGLVISLLPALAMTGGVDLGVICGVMFLQASLQVFALAGEFSAVVALVEPERLPAVNGLLSASYSAARVAGTAMAGLLLAVAPVASALWVDGASFFVAAAAMAAIRTGFNASPPPGLRTGSARALARNLIAETRAGLDYVWHHRLLRNVSLQLTAVNLFGSAATAQLALFAVRRLGSDNSRVGYLYSASSIGVVLVSLLVAPLARRISLATIVTMALVLYGAGTAVFGLNDSYRGALLLQGCVGGSTVLYNTATASLRQRLVPNELLGRVWNIALTTAWCAMPLGALAGGAVAATGRVTLLYVTAGTGIVLLAVVFHGRIRESPPTGGSLGD